jgi:hypothetical protein
MVDWDAIGSKPLDPTVVQAWLAWNESDVFSDASVRHLQSLITDFSRAIFRVLDWSLLRANICVRDIHGSARFCTCHYEVARLRIYLYLRWLDLGECGVASPVDAQKFCDRAAWNVGMVTIDAFQPSDLATPIRFVEVIQEHERIEFDVNGCEARIALVVLSLPRGPKSTRHCARRIG